MPMGPGDGGGSVDISGLETSISGLVVSVSDLTDDVDRDRPLMLFESSSGDDNAAIIVIPVSGSATDVDFPGVTVAGIPPGAIVTRADVALIIGSLFNTATSENQIATSGTLRVMVASGVWGTDDEIALYFVENSLQVASGSYGSGRVLFGAEDVKQVVVGDGDYSFRSEHSVSGQGVTASSAGLEIHDAAIAVRMWYR